MSYGKAWFEGQRGKFGYVDYWIAADFSHGRAYLSKFVFKESNSIGGPANSVFIGAEWRVIISAPSERWIGVHMLGTWNGTPALGTVYVSDPGRQAHDGIEFVVYSLFGVRRYSLSGPVVQGDCQIHFSP
ncbi:MAG: hypothetical protein AMXMBFR61_08520 [Fimbriimonadales bacterium]